MSSRAYTCSRDRIAHGLGFVDYHLNVFALSWPCERGVPAASGLRRRSVWAENLLRRSPFFLGLAGEKMPCLPLSSPHVPVVSFSFGRHRYADLWRPWNTILMRPLLPSYFAFFASRPTFAARIPLRHMRLFGDIACFTSRCSNIADLSNAEYIRDAKLPRVWRKFRPEQHERDSLFLFSLQPALNIFTATIGDWRMQYVDRCNKCIYEYCWIYWMIV